MRTVRQLHRLSGAGSITRQEIFQQPALWATTLERVKRSGLSFSAASGPVVVTGAGTSAYAAEAIARAWPRAKAVPSTDLLLHSKEELIRINPDFAERGALISIARSGESPESIAVIEKIRQLFPAIRHLVITSNPEGRLAKLSCAEQIILDPRTNDRSLVMTSSFTNLVLAGLGLFYVDQLEPVLPSICRHAQESLPEMDEIARQAAVSPPDRCAVLASCDLQPLAKEAALKVLEMTAGNVVALPETFLGLRHGPMSFLRPGSMVLCWMSSNAMRRRYEYDLIQELRTKGLGKLLIIGPADVAIERSDLLIPAQSLQIRDEWRAPFEMPFGQLLAYHLSLQYGLNPDNPSPNGVITRVVRGFRLHEHSDNCS